MVRRIGIIEGLNWASRSEQGLLGKDDRVFGGHIHEDIGIF